MRDQKAENLWSQILLGVSMMKRRSLSQTCRTSGSIRMYSIYIACNLNFLRKKKNNNADCSCNNTQTLNYVIILNFGLLPIIFILLILGFGFGFGFGLGFFYWRFRC